MSTTRWFDGFRWMTLLGVMMWTASSIAQEAANRAEPPSPGPLDNPVSDSVRELREQIRELQAAVAGMRSDWQRAREETAELRRELDEIRSREVRAETTPRNAVAREIGGFQLRGRNKITRQLAKRLTDRRSAR